MKGLGGTAKRSRFLYTGDFAISNGHHFLQFWPILANFLQFSPILPFFWPGEGGVPEGLALGGTAKRGRFFYTGDFALSDFHHFLQFYPILAKIGQFP